MIQTNRSGDITVQSAAAPGAAVSGYRPETPRILIYSPDSYGLGHFRRCLKVSEVFKQKSPDLGILLVTGSPHAGRYRLPNGVDLLSLPAVVKTGDNQYEARSPDTSFREISELRQNLISDAVRSFKPDLILVDHNPVGLKGELRKTLAWIKDQDSGCQIILGMRDIIDEPESVLASWAADNIHEVLEDVYDRIFIYGTPEVFDPISGYQFGPKARAKSSCQGRREGVPLRRRNRVPPAR